MAAAATRGIYITGAKRTPFGSFGGSLKAFTATDLATLSSVGAIKQSKVDPAAVDSVFVGNVIQSSPDAAYLARHVGLRAGVPQEKAALTINRLCGSGFEAVCLGAEAIELDQARVTLCGGSELAKTFQRGQVIPMISADAQLQVNGRPCFRLGFRGHIHSHSVRET